MMALFAGWEWLKCDIDAAQATPRAKKEDGSLEEEMKKEDIEGNVKAAMRCYTRVPAYYRG